MGARARKENSKERKRRIGAREVLHSSESTDWCTPDYVLDIARNTMGGIDLDPASSKRANKRVRAKHIFTIRDDGLKQKWFGRVWCNCPYGFTADGRSSQGVWAEKNVFEFESKNAEQLCFLVNAVPDRKWFQMLWRYPILFPDHRIKFISAIDGAVKNQPTHPNALIYMGPHVDRFECYAGVHGHVVLPKSPVQRRIIRAPVGAIHGV